MWMGSSDGSTKLAPALVTLIHQLEAAYPAQAWQTSPQTGTIGDAAHAAEGSASDHNAWLDNTVRALDVAANTPGGPDAEALFQMVNRMYAAQDARVWPNGYAIYNGRITDWDNPGGFHTQDGDPHLEHVHISVSQNPAGFNSAAPWPLPGEGVSGGTSHPVSGGFMPDLTEAEQREILSAAQAWNKRLAKFDALLYAFSSQGYMQAFARGVTNVVGRIATKIGA
jgi:hypothetical protein